jgi:hypothetical protein
MSNLEQAPGRVRAPPLTDASWNWPEVQLYGLTTRTLVTNAGSLPNVDAMTTWRQSPVYGIPVDIVIPKTRICAAMPPVTYTVTAHLWDGAAGYSRDAWLKVHVDLREAIASPNYGTCGFQNVRSIWEQQYEYVSDVDGDRVVSRWVYLESQYDGLMDVSPLIRRCVRWSLGQAAIPLTHAPLLDIISGYV